MTRLSTILKKIIGKKMNKEYNLVNYKDNKGKENLN